MKNIVSKFTHIEVSPYEKGEEPHLEKSLQVFDWIYHRVTLSCFFIENNTLLLPRSLSPTVLKAFFKSNIKIDNTEIEAKECIFELKTKPRDNNQYKAIRFLTGVKEFEKIKYCARLNLELDTGIGKTYCTIAALWYFKKNSAIIVHLSKLITQWKQRIIEYTNISEEEICIIKGKESIRKLQTKGIRNYKVFIVSHKTLGRYAKEEGWDKVQELFELMKIGIKVYDEAHLEFKNIIAIDLHTNVRKTFYLTATAGRSDKSQNKIYHKVLGSSPTLTIKIPQSERKNNSLIIKISTFPSQITEKSLYTQRGMNGVRYLRYLFTKGFSELSRAIKLSLNALDSVEGTFAILVGLKENALILKNFIESNYENYKDDVGIVDSDVKEEDQQKVLKNKKIIITTNGSFGTGLDLKNLNVIINIEPYSSEITIRQLIGRLRNKGFYIEIFDKTVEKRNSQFETVKNIISECSHKVIIKELKNETYE